MFRGLWSFVAILLIATGLVITVINWTVNGWTVISGIGVAMLVADIWYEDAVMARERETREVQS